MSDEQDIRNLENIDQVNNDSAAEKHESDADIAVAEKLATTKNIARMESEALAADEANAADLADEANNATLVGSEESQPITPNEIPATSPNEAPSTSPEGPQTTIQKEAPATTPIETPTTRSTTNGTAAPPTAPSSGGVKRFSRPLRSVLPEQVQRKQGYVPAALRREEVYGGGRASGSSTAHKEPTAVTVAEAAKKRKVRQPLSNKKIVFLSFLIPFLGLAFAYASNNFYPIGNKTPLTIDLYHQYAPFLQQLRDKLLAGESLFYSWNSGLGTNFYAQMAYYSASPFNIILLLFPPEFLSEAVTALTLLKIGSIGATTSYMLLHGFCPAKMRTIGDAPPAELRYTSQVGTDYLIIALSASFALSGFMLSYSWDIMWLDAIIFLPLIILGLIRLLTQSRFLLYVLSLAACIMVNYYIALFICMFTALYFFVAYFSFESGSFLAKQKPARHFIFKGLQFAGASLLGAAISAVMSLPTYLALQGTSATSDAFPTAVKMNFSIFSFLQRQLIAAEPAIREGLPNVYIGVIAMLMIPLYIFVKEIKLKEKLWHLGLLFFMFVSFSNNYLDFIWHGTHYPNQLPFRYAFVYSLLLIIISFRTLTYIRTISGKIIAGAGVAAVLYAILAEELLKDDVSHVSVYVSILFFVIYVAILAAFKKGKGFRSFRNVAFALSMIIVTELMLNSLLSVVYIHKNEYYTSRNDFNNDFTQMRNEIALLEANDPSFWRMEMIQQKTTNSPALYGYKGITLFSSTSYESTAQLMRKLGFHGNNINSYKYMASSDLMNAVLGVKYLINKERAIRDPELTLLRDDGKSYVYENPLALPLGFMVRDQIFNWDTFSNNPFVVQNKFVAASGQHGVVYEARSIGDQKAGNYSFNSMVDDGLQATPGDNKLSGSIEFTITPQKSEHLYFYLNVSAETQVDMSIVNVTQPPVAPVTDPNSSGAGAGAEGAMLSSSTNVVLPTNASTVAQGAVDTSEASTTFADNRSINTQEIFDCGFVELGQQVKVKITTKEDKSRNISIYAAASNQEALERNVAGWREGGLKISSYSDNRVIGTVNAAEAGQLFLTIPYDASWRAKVDGVEVTPTHVAHAFMAVPVPQGEHSIEIYFIPPGFENAVLISVVGIALLILALLFHKIVKKKRILANNQE